MQQLKSNRDGVVYLRAVAALMVLLFHYISSANGFTSSFTSVSSIGQLGVHVFFVISGFVIPIQLQRRNYKYKNMKDFFLNRVVRIYPCFLVIILGATAIWQLQYILVGGGAPDLSFFNIIKNVFLLVNILEGTHFLSVSWTLWIEFSYYLILAFLYPVMFSGSMWKFGFCSIGLLCLSLLGEHESQFVNFFKWSPFFVAGFALFVIYYMHHLKVGLFILLLSLIFIVFRDGFHPGWIQCIVCLLSILWIHYLPEVKLKVPYFLGVISYSLYLVHAPIGHRVFGVFRHFLGEVPFIEWLSFLVALGFSIAISWLVFVVVEKSSHKLSKKIW